MVQFATDFIWLLHTFTTYHRFNDQPVLPLGKQQMQEKFIPNTKT